MNLMTSSEGKRWYGAPASVVLERDGIVALLDPEAPNWIATDPRGARIFSQLDGRTPLAEIAAAYAREEGVDSAKA